MSDQNENQNTDTSQLTITDLQKELPAQDYETLTLGEDTVATRALLKAKIAVKGMVQSTGNVYSEETRYAERLLSNMRCTSCLHLWEKKTAPAKNSKTASF